MLLLKMPPVAGTHLRRRPFTNDSDTLLQFTPQGNLVAPIPGVGSFSHKPWRAISQPTVRTNLPGDPAVRLLMMGDPVRAWASMAGGHRRLRAITQRLVQFPTQFLQFAV